MRTVFVDTFFWIAYVNRRDPWHDRVHAVRASLSSYHFVTSDEILDELLAFYSAAGPIARIQVAQAVRRLLENAGVEVVPASRTRFTAALDLYEARPDKQYSLTDCNSMCLMRERGIVEVLTNDIHFRQEGFQTLFGSQR